MAAHGNGQHLRLEPGAVTVGADTCRHVALDVLADAFTPSVFVALLEVGDDALKVGGIVVRAPMLRRIANGQLLGSTIQHLPALLIRQVTPGRMQAEVVLFRQRLQSGSVPLTTLLHGAIAPPSRLNSGWVTISSASISCCVPRPVQVGHAPCGLLKLKVRGAISGRLMPQ